MDRDEQIRAAALQAAATMMAGCAASNEGSIAKVVDEMTREYAEKYEEYIRDGFCEAD